MNTADATELVNRALHRIAPEVDADDIDRSERLQDEFDLDSIDFLNLLEAIAAETGRDIPERDYPAVATFDGLVAYLTDA